MATITVTIPDDKLVLVVTALCELYNYAANGGGLTPPLAA